jgi:MORN repeat
MHGKGVKVMANGDVFNGNWQNDKAEGAGVKVFACGGKCY